MDARDGASALLAVGRRTRTARATRACSRRAASCASITASPSRATRRSTALASPRREALGAARQGHRLGDRGVRRSLEEQELGRAEAEQMSRTLMDFGGVRRKRSSRASIWPSRRSAVVSQQAGEGPIAGRQQAPSCGWPGEGLVERPRSPRTRSSTSSATRRRRGPRSIGAASSATWLDRRSGGRLVAAAARPGPAGSGRRSRPGRRTRRRCQSAGPRSGRAGSRRAPGTSARRSVGEAVPLADLVDLLLDRLGPWSSCA